MCTPDFFHNIRCLKKKHFLINSFSCTAFYVSPAEWKWMTCRFLLPPQLFCVISIKRHIHGKSFYAEPPPPLPPPPQLSFSAHKKQVEKRVASVGEVGGSWREMIDRDIYVCVWSKSGTKKVEYLCCSFECILFSFLLRSSISLTLLHLI